MLALWVRRVTLLLGFFACNLLFSLSLHAAMASRLDRLFLGDDRAIARVQTLEFYGKQLKSYMEQRSERIAQLEGLHKSKDEIEQDADVRRIGRAIELYDDLLAPRNQAAMAFARGLVGSSNMAALEGVPINNFSDAFFQGLSIRAAMVLGDLFGDKVRVAVDKLLGPACDYLIETAADYARDINSLVFHESKDPFSPEDLTHWAEFIVSCLTDFSSLIKGRMDFESRSSTMNVRAFDADDIANSVDPKQIVWDSLINGYAEQFSFFVSEIDRRIGYYKNDIVIVFYANQLKNRLSEFRSILLGTKSLKDLSTKFGDNSLLIIAIINNIKKLFDKLTVVVKGPVSSLSGRDSKRPLYSSSYADSSQKLYGGYGYNSRYGQGDFEPMPYDTGWAGA